MNFADTLCSLAQPYDIQEGSPVSRHVFANFNRCINAADYIYFRVELTLRITVCRL